MYCYSPPSLPLFPHYMYLLLPFAFSFPLPSPSSSPSLLLLSLPPPPLPPSLPSFSPLLFSFLLFSPPLLQVVNAKLLYTNISETSMNSSDNSTDSSEGSPMAHLDGPNIDMEKLLPSVVKDIRNNVHCIVHSML